MTGLKRIFYILLGLIFGVSQVSASDAIIDCPNRDSAFSVDLPLLDILLNTEAEAILNTALNERSKKLPEDLLKKSVPSFTTIVAVSDLVGLLQLDSTFVPELNNKLGRLIVSDIDRRARCARYDNDQPLFELTGNQKKILVFQKINGFHHGNSVTMATSAIEELGKKLGWSVSITDKGGAFTPELLSQFDVVIWNNNSGDVLTMSQRNAFEEYINAGGGYLGIHGAGGDTRYYWEWYSKILLGAQFTGHPGSPQFQRATLHVLDNPARIAKSLGRKVTLEDEWYSFQKSARISGADIIVNLDESTYVPEGWHGEDISMGKDHPIVWSRCVGKGRAFYTAIGHRPDLYSSAANLTLLEDALLWAGGEINNYCDSEILKNRVE
mgnify:CR=1 FL=1